jgi:hypothetical protein
MDKIYINMSKYIKDVLCDLQDAANALQIQMKVMGIETHPINTTVENNSSDLTESDYITLIRELYREVQARERLIVNSIVNS